MTSTRPASATSALPGVAVAALVGVLVAAQSRANADLSVAGAGPLLAGWASYVGTLATIAVVVAARGRAAATARTMRDRGRWWWYAIGLCGIPIVLATAYGVPIVGVAIASVAAVAGQTVAGLALDARGVGVPRRLPLTGRRLLAALTALVGLGLAMLAGSDGSAVDATLAITVGVLLFAAGVTLAMQNAGNGAVARDSGDPAIAGLTSATGGTVAISLLVAGAAAAGELSGATMPTDPGSWPLYLGGPLGAGIVVAAAWAVRRLGTFALTLTVVAGQLVAAMAIDAARGLDVPWTTWASVIAIVAGTTLSVAARPRRPKSG